MKKTTIKDVARRSGMSIATVSQILNQRGHFTQSTINKVNIATKELGYVPDKNAKQLRKGSAVTITVVLPNLTNPFFSSLVQSMQQYLETSGYDNIDLTFQTSAFNRLDETINNLINRGIDGLIITEPLPNPIHTHELLTLHHIPYVVTDRNADSNLTDSVSTNEFSGGELAAQHLKILGHRKVGLITPSYISPSIGHRIDGFMSLWPSTGDMQPRQFYTEFSMNGGKQIAREIAKSDVTGIFTLNDEVAIGLIRGLSDLSLSVPENLSIIGFDDIDYANYTVPTLTTVAQPISEIGSASLSLLIQRLINNSTSDVIPQIQRLTFNNKLVARESTKVSNH
ncbi:LacI family DNA-binding transcriptional regulator [Latilactobacillus fuchuensis]|uniref:LacI family regulatory protein n=1 Tax=Latilactobacillus fuchuensis DSM 14340 = JCM 11249 TaxID=1423747 RepID=A0A0R1S0I5_9LACO|nr:LacI family DNA-binding transcriptional regulator [Latilactobacillus fuchuensis]KRL59208.1 LacI family regulatory protein [Latilactobacillus fuchuensis DSM 14340 = JCM 11249]